MSKNSPITQRVQKALYMRSAVKQTENNEEKPKTTFVDDPRRGTVVEGQMVETLVPGATTNEGLEGSYTGDNLYKGDYYSADSPLGREMAKLGIENITPDSIKDYEKSKLIKNRKSGNTGEFGGVKATNEAGETRDVSDDELQNISDDNIMSRNVSTQGPDEIVETFEGEDVPQDFAVQTQGQAGANARGNRKKINTTMRNERKLGAFKGKNPETGKRWKKHEKKLYAAKLLSGQDMGYGSGIGKGGQSYESNKMVFQKNAGDTENQTYTNINDPKYRTNEQINPTTYTDEETGETVNQGDLVQKNITMKESTAAKMLGTTPLKSKMKSILKSAQKGKQLANSGGNFPAVIPPKTKLPDPSIKKPGDVEIIPGTGSSKNKKKPNYDKISEDAVIVKDPVTKGGKNLNKKGGLLDKAKGLVKKVTPGGKTMIGLAGLGAGYYMGTRGGDDVKVDNTNSGGGNGGGNGGGGTNNNTTTTTTTPPKRTTGTTTVNGVRRDLPVAKPSNPVTVSDNLSTSSNRSAERQANRQQRFENRQARRTQRLENRQTRRNARRANPTLVGGALRKTFGGKKMDTNVNNMAQQPPQGYNQNDKKKKGQFGNTGRPGYSAA